MGYYLSMPILLLLVALQSSLIPGLRLFSGQPDFVFVVILIRAVHADLEEALFWAFLGGIMQDLLSATPIGTSSITMIVLIFIMHAIRSQIFRINLVLLALFIATGTFLQQGIAFMVHQLIGAGSDFAAVFQYVMLPTLLYNLVCMLPVYIIMRILHGLIDRPAIR